MTVINMDCREGMATMIAADSIDAIVTDPPYGLSKQPDMAEVLRHWLAGDDYVSNGRGFMGKSWDSFVPGPATWREAFRCLKPGGWAVVFAGSRTQDLMSVSLRLAGFEVMDVGQWLYGSGFPKSLDISKAIDKAAGAEREVIGRSENGIAGGSGEFTAGNAASAGFKAEYDITAPATDAAKQWDGWGTALKPGYEPFILCRKPLDGTYANNVLKHGVGALNIDGTRGDGDRWPANVVTTDLDEPWAKYFYHAKASKADRDEGLEHLGVTDSATLVDRTADSDGMNSPRAGAGRTSGRRNIHPTVKPTALMQWLCRLVTPPGGTVLDPFTGSGSTGKAAMLEGFNFIGFELDPQYAEIAQARIDHARNSR